MGILSRKAKLFIFGISIGLIAICLFFVFKHNNVFSKIGLHEKETKSTIQEDALEATVAEKTNSNTTEENFKSTSDDSHTHSSTTNSSEPNNYSATNEENITVLKEELVGVKNIYLKNFDTNSDYKGISDSVLTAMSGISPDKKNDFYMIEFWKTPLNSKGYKMTRNRVLIYGLKEKEDIALVKLNDNYYFKNNSEVYKLSYSPDFKPMEKISEASILQKIN